MLHVCVGCISPTKVLKIKGVWFFIFANYTQKKVRPTIYKLPDDFLMLEMTRARHYHGNTIFIAIINT